MQKTKRLLLVGGGHAHVFLIKQFCLKNIPGLEVVLVTAGQYQYYSGMAAGYVEGIYKEEDMSFDLKKMCQKSRVKYIEGRILLYLIIIHIKTDLKGHNIASNRIKLISN
ncbi:MAG: hypothetical protein MUO60_16420 [Clostridiaceae bacterium]|nr:hypothetical protein [Clostridiaceae bacterium]